jgi:hypothetical protein
MAKATVMQTGSRGPAHSLGAAESSMPNGEHKKTQDLM